jgi:hypothetical protein
LKDGKNKNNDKDWEKVYNLLSRLIRLAPRILGDYPEEELHGLTFAPVVRISHSQGSGQKGSPPLAGHKHNSHSLRKLHSGIRFVVA